jgi:TRAP-type C4-dicarboxylate transport system substrate-binding protein
MGEEWKKATDRKWRLQISAGGTAGDEAAVVKKMRIKQYQAAALTGVGLSEIVPEIMTMQLPMLIRTDEELDYVRDKLAARFEAQLKKEHFILLNWGEAGWAHFFGKNRVVSLSDMRKAKLFCWAGNDGEFAGWKDVGVTPVSISPTEIHTALESGRIDAFATSAIAAETFQWFRYAPEMSGMRWAPLVGATIITEEAWNSLPEDAKPALLESAKRAGERFRSETRKKSGEAVETMKKRGLHVQDASAEVCAEWEAEAVKAWHKLMGEHYSPDLVGEVRNYLADVRAKLKEGSPK